MRWLLLSFFFVFPSTSFAAVIINEVAWMGSVDSANHEWIELYNDGSVAVDVSGWVLSDGMKLEIILEGVISAGSYVVLERSSDESAPGVAHTIYTGALVNTGATLSLKRADGSLEDQVSGGENWENIGGDNTTKETAQYTTGGWITAGPTPGRNNATEGTVKNESATQSSISYAKPAAGKKVSEPVRLVLPGVTLELEPKAQTLGYVNQEISFSVEPAGIGESLIDSLEYSWNFGDGYVEEGKDVSHVFSYPGTYVVTVYGEYKRQRQVARHEITILPVTLSLTRNSKGDIQLNNDSPYEIDLSGYLLQASKKFIFPARSIILPNQTITLHKDKIGTGPASVFDTALALVSTELQKAATFVAENTPTITTPVVYGVYTEDVEDEKFGFSENNKTVTSTSVITIEKADEGQGDDEKQNSAQNNTVYLLLVGVIAVGTLGVLIKPKT